MCTNPLRDLYFYHVSWQSWVIKQKRFKNIANKPYFRSSTKYIQISPPTDWYPKKLPSSSTISSLWSHSPPRNWTNLRAKFPQEIPGVLGWAKRPRLESSKTLQARCSRRHRIQNESQFSNFGVSMFKGILVRTEPVTQHQSCKLTFQHAWGIWSKLQSNHIFHEYLYLLASKKKL